MRQKGKKYSLIQILANLIVIFYEVKVEIIYFFEILEIKI